MLVKSRFGLLTRKQISFICLETINKCIQTRSLCSSLKSQGPLELLKSKVKSNELTSDGHQLRVAQSLQIVYERIQDYEPEPLDDGVVSKWFNVFSGKPKEKPSPPKGLYIYGSVGEGKTMLMDLFFHSCTKVISNK